MIVRRDELISGQYFVAIAGVAAIRRILLAPSDVMPRLDDARRVIEAFDEFPNNIRIPVVECDVIEAYDAWAPVYDSGPNAATERDSEVVRELLEPLPRGRALDAACGTGRQSELLAELGYDVEGVDLNETMLGFARARVPAAHFVQGRLEEIPHDDASFDVAVCSLALTHLPELLPGIAELARVVKPGGYAVISDIHPMAVHLGVSAGFRAPDITEGVIQVPNLLHEVSEYVGAFLATGWEICGCIESVMPESAISGHPAYAVVPDAVRDAFEGVPLLLAWLVRRRD